MSIALALAFATGCKKREGADPAAIAKDVETLAGVVSRDVAEVRRGLPLGARDLVDVFGSDGRSVDRAAARKALDTARAKHPDLGIAKSTFFALTDRHGVVVASDRAPDSLEGKALGSSFPALERALGGGAIETYGEMAELASRGGADEEWVAAVPVAGPSGVLGAYVTGWSLRRFAYHLQETFRTAVTKSAGSTPLVYVFFFRGETLWAAPVTPQVDVDAVKALGLVEKTGAGPWSTSIEVTGRRFGLAARRTPDMGPDAGVAVLRSEI